MIGIDGNMLLYYILLLLMSAGSFIMSYLAYKRPDVAGSKPFAALYVALGIWGMAYCLDFQYLSNSASLLAVSNYIFIGVVFVAPAWFLFTLEYTGHDALLKNNLWYLLLVIPILTLFIALTNFGDLFYTFTTVYSADGSATTIVSYGIWYGIHTIYSYILIMSGYLLLIKVYFDLPLYYRSRILLLIFGSTVPLIGNCIYILDIIPNLVVDITPFFFFTSGIVLYLAVFLYPDNEIMPYTKDTIIEIMNDAIFVIDKSGRIVDSNPVARRYGELASGQTRFYGRAITDVFASLKDQFPQVLFDRNEKLKKREYLKGTNVKDDPFLAHLEFIVTVKNGGKTYYFNVRETPIISGGEFNGRLVIGKDVTFYKQTMWELTYSNEHYINLYNNISDGIILHEIDENSHCGRVFDVNNVILRMLGYTLEEFRAAPPEYIRERIFKYGDTAFSRISEKESTRYELKLVKKDGSMIPVQVTSRKVRIEGRMLMISLVRDITDEKRSREVEMQAILQIERNLKHLSTISDDLKKPLMVIEELCSSENACSKAPVIITQIGIIADIAEKLDQKCLESNKIHGFLKKHYAFEKKMPMIEYIGESGLESAGKDDLT